MLRKGAEALEDGTDSGAPISRKTNYRRAGDGGRYGLPGTYTKDSQNNDLAR